jgi:uncharacterized protein YkwD
MNLLLLRTVRRFVPVVVVLLFIGAVYQAQTPRSSNDIYAARQVLALINEYRIQNNLTPLRESETLDALAFYHANEVSTWRTIPDGAAIHTNRAGHGVQDRARYEQFNWPAYRPGDKPIVGEIAAVRTIAEAMGFWKSSAPHRSSMTTEYYREAGVAAIPRGGGRYIFIVVFGARPNVLPAMRNPQDGKLYLTRDLYPFAKSKDLLLQPNQVQLFGESGRPISNWLNWAPSIDIPSGNGGVVFVLYRNSSAPDVQVISEVALRENIVMLPGFVPTPSPTPTATPTLTPSNTPTPMYSPTPSITPTPSATLTPTPVPGPEVRLIYDADQFTLLNQERWDVNLFPLSFRSGRQTVSALYWRDVSGEPLASFPPKGCLQAWTSDRFAPPPLPSECPRRTGGRGRLTASERFWINDFEVLYNGEVIATCKAAPGVCEADLPGRP